MSKTMKAAVVREFGKPLTSGQVHSSVVLDLVGIGAGPSNLSLAALLAKEATVNAIFLERQPFYEWHGGMLLPDSYLQINILKDLVTPIDPTNRFSFLNYLVLTGRFYSFVTADFARVHRRDYSAYLEWVGSELSSVSRGEDVHQVSYAGLFELRTNKRALRTKAISVGVGQVPNIPSCVPNISSGRIVHSSNLMTSRQDTDGDRDVIVVGGGQSGAEVFLYLLGERDKWRRLTWISRRTGFPSLEESHFTNEFFTPSHAKYFKDLPADAKSRQTRDQKYANDGISQDTVASIYRALYKHRYHGGDGSVEIRDATELVRTSPSEDSVGVAYKCLRTGCVSDVVVDRLILCTGYRQELPVILRDVCSGRITADSYDLDENFRLRWDAPDDSSIYLMNAGIRTYGIADSNLSITAWRAATVANHIAGAPIYNTDHDPTMLGFHDEAAGPGPFARHNERIGV